MLKYLREKEKFNILEGTISGIIVQQFYTVVEVINPLRMRKRVTVVVLSVCVYVCVSVTALTARVMIFAIQPRFYRNRHGI